MNLRKCLKGLTKGGFEMEHADSKFLEEIKQIMNDYVEYLYSMGLEQDENGNIIESSTKKLVLKIDDEDE